MKSIFKILILAAVPILAVTAVVDQGLAADAGSQLIFQSNMAHQDYISVANTNDKMAVTVLVQYYNDEMTRFCGICESSPVAETSWSTRSIMRFQAKTPP